MEVTTGMVSRNASQECVVSAVDADEKKGKDKCREFEQGGSSKSLARVWSRRSKRQACREKPML